MNPSFSAELQLSCGTGGAILPIMFLTHVTHIEWYLSFGSAEIPLDVHNVSFLMQLLPHYLKTNSHRLGEFLFQLSMLFDLIS